MKTRLFLSAALLLAAPLSMAFSEATHGLSEHLQIFYSGNTNGYLKACG